MGCKCKCKKEDGFIEFLIKEKSKAEEILDEQREKRYLVGMDAAIKEIHFIDNCMYLYQTWKNEN